MRICEHKRHGECMFRLFGGRPSDGVCRGCVERIDPITPEPEPVKPAAPAPVRKAAPLAAEEQKLVDGLLHAASTGGLGDELQRAIAAVGADTLAKAWEWVTGHSCGCDGRRKRLNELFPGGWRQLMGVPGKSMVELGSIGQRSAVGGGMTDNGKGLRAVKLTAT